MENRWAIITGGTKGIGWAIAQRFAAEGINIIITSRTMDDLVECRTHIIENFSGVDCCIFKADLSHRLEVSRFSKFVRETVDGLDILVNNAGAFLMGSVLTEEEGNLETQIETNLYSGYYLTRDLIDLLRASSRGYILNMCSIASLIAYPNAGSYAISKFAMLGWTKVLRSELKDTNIGVSAIMPGATWSASWAGAEDEYPRERLMEPENIADVCWTIVNLAPNAVLEEVIIRPQKGDL